MESVRTIIDTALTEGRGERKKESWYVTDLSRCLRGVYLERTGVKGKDIDSRTLRVFKCGNIFEDFVVERLKEKGLLCSAQELVDFQEFNLHGRYDAIIGENGVPERVVEIKSQHSQAFHWRDKMGGLAQEQHVEQVSLYLYKLREKYPNLQASVVYVSKDDLAIAECPVALDKIIIDKALAKAKILVDCWWAKTEPPITDPVVWDPAKKKWAVDWKAKYCGVHDICVGDEKWLEKALFEAKDKNSRTI